MKRNHKYIVTLTNEERNMLQDLIAKGRTQGYRIKHAQILLKLDEIPGNREWTYAKIQEAYHATPHTICQIAKRFVTGGVEAALGRKEQVNRHKKVDGRVEAHIILKGMPIDLGVTGDGCTAFVTRNEKAIW